MENILKQKFAWTDSELEKEKKRICKSVYKHEKHEQGFNDSDALATWWIEQLKIQKGCCNYCDTSIKLIRDLIDNDLLAGRPVKGDAIRGCNLELERKDHKFGYTPENCVLICYYCNNDKSNVYPWDEYKKYLAPAKHNHFMALADILNKKSAA
ncbi:MAG: hypothetical protein AB7O96_08675 [Pseudobdellovibrionaceae bacterium]